MTDRARKLLAEQVAHESLFVIAISAIGVFALPEPLSAIFGFPFSIACFVMADACAAIQDRKAWFIRSLDAAGEERGG